MLHLKYFQSVRYICQHMTPSNGSRTLKKMQRRHAEMKGTEKEGDKSQKVLRVQVRGVCGHPKRKC